MARGSIPRALAQPSASGPLGNGVLHSSLLRPVLGEMTPSLLDGEARCPIADEGAAMTTSAVARSPVNGRGAPGQMLLY